MPVEYLGVRHHSPACARLVASTIEALSPAYVLIEGPVEMNDRLDEFLLGHQLPIAVFTGYRDGDIGASSWAPFCEYSPEWQALTAGRRAGAQVRFIDLPAWHPALAERTNRYADEERWYALATERLCAEFGVDNPDVLWDQLAELDPGDDLADRLATYFDLLRGDLPASDGDARREEYMARWVAAARADAGDAPVVVVTGGFHRPALIRLADIEPDGWPDVPVPDGNAWTASYLVPFSFRRLDAFDGYQSGMPSPEYYQQLWQHGPAAAADRLTATVVGRLRERGQHVSTADLIAARTTAGALSAVRGHRQPSRTDVLDALASALVTEALEVPLPWTGRGRLAAGTHPVVVEMVAALAGERTGRLHPDTPQPPLVGDVQAQLVEQRLDGDGEVRLDLAEPAGLAASRLLHRLRILGITGFDRLSGPAIGEDPVLDERWRLTPGEARTVGLIEAAGYGTTLADAAAARLAERVTLATTRPGPAGPAGGVGPASPPNGIGPANPPGSAGDLDALAAILFDAAHAGLTTLAGRTVGQLAAGLSRAADLGGLGRVLAVLIALWRQDTLLGTAGDATLAELLPYGVDRAVWLAERTQGAGPAEPRRLAALAAVRDAVRHQLPGVDSEPVLAAMRRLGANRAAPPDLRGAAYGLCWALGDPVADAAVSAAGRPGILGDWLAGLFALAREEALADESVSAALDQLVADLTDDDFLAELPALRQAFRYFPPRERVRIAERIAARHGRPAPGRTLLRLPDDPLALAAATALDSQVHQVLVAEGLIAEGSVEDS